MSDGEQCVAYVRRVTGLPASSLWRRGVKVRDANLPASTAIATFDPNGTYGNHTDGRSHAALYLDQSAEGLRVTDAWIGHPAAERTIRFKQGGDAADNGNEYYVVETTV
jgi:hypothetical protein